MRVYAHGGSNPSLSAMNNDNNFKFDIIENFENNSVTTCVDAMKMDGRFLIIGTGNLNLFFSHNLSGRISNWEPISGG